MKYQTRISMFHYMTPRNSLAQSKCQHVQHEVQHLIKAAHHHDIKNSMQSRQIPGY